MCIPFQDEDELLIPLMKKGHIPRGPPRFGKRGGANSPSNHLRLRQFSLYGPMMHLLPRNNEMQDPYGF
uniref:Uncharacterized protein n=1 Tax=Panagrolaimus sp. PS1159 TaxID=55785 RepID=A0AC35G7L9_9BILA